MSLFWNHDERRLRALWRLLLQALMLGVALVGLAVLAALFSTTEGDESTLGIAACLLLIATVWLASRLLDRRPLADLGLRIDRAWTFDCCFGVLLGVAMMGGIFVVELVAGWVAVRATPTLQVSSTRIGLALGGAFVEFVLVAVSEELFSRGYQLRNLAEGLKGQLIGPRAALIASVVLTAAAFAVLHLPDRNASVLSGLNTFVAGLLLAIGVIYTGRLGLPIGVHITWNFTQGPLLGFAVSGNAPRVALLTTDTHGPALWTGGEYGPEGGLLATVTFSIAIVLTLAWIRVRCGPLRLRTALTAYRRR
ncbi:MAG: lysostaphin resistance A-like protein [Phycisphaerae bacterium]